MNHREAFEAWGELTAQQKQGDQHDIVGWHYFDEDTNTRWEAYQAAIASQAPRQALTDAEIFTIHDKTNDAESQILAFARAIEAASGPNAALVAALREIIANDPFNVHNSSIIARAALAAVGVEP